MKAEEFKLVEQLSEQAEEVFEALLGSSELAGLREGLQKVSAKIPFSLSVDFTLTVFDGEREQGIRLVTRSLCASGGDEPYLAPGDSTIHRYIVDGEICQVPHDYCPHCWAEWDFKLKHQTCPGCGYAMGRQVKLLLDSSVCPNCDEGEVSLAKPVCAKCGFVVDPRMIAWG